MSRFGIYKNSLTQWLVYKINKFIAMIFEEKIKGFVSISVEPDKVCVLLYN